MRFLSRNASMFIKKFFVPFIRNLILHQSLSRFISNVTKRTMTKLNIFLLSFQNAATPVQYQIASGNAGATFGIHNSTGLIYIACALDYEKIKKVSELLHMPHVVNDNEQYRIVNNFC